MNSLYIFYLLREFNSNSPSISRINFEFFILKRIHFELTIFSWIHFEFSLFFANSLTIPFEFSSLWIHHLFSEFTLNSRIHLKFIFTFEFTFLRELTDNFLLIQFAMNSLSATFNFASWLSIHYLFTKRLMTHEFF